VIVNRFQLQQFRAKTPGLQELEIEGSKARIPAAAPHVSSETRHPWLSQRVAKEIDLDADKILDYLDSRFQMSRDKAYLDLFDVKVTVPFFGSFNYLSKPPC